MAKQQPYLWERLAGQARGAGRSLDVQAITTAAVSLADAQGLEAVSMRNIAARLGRSPMALYRYIGGKDELSELMDDAVLEDVLAQIKGSGPQDWRGHLQRLAGAYRGLYLAHPWLLQLARRPSLGPNALALLECSLAPLDSLGLSIDAMLDVLSTPLHFTQGFVADELAEQQAQRRSGLDAGAWQAHTEPFVNQLVRAGQHPYMERIIKEAEDFPAAEQVFERRLEMVLDGLAVGLAAHS